MSVLPETEATQAAAKSHWPITCPDTGETCHSYDDYLKSQHWALRRAAFLVAQGSDACTVCGRRPASVHHKTYVRIGKEEDGDMGLLCARHHRTVHRLDDRRISAPQHSSALGVLSLMRVVRESRVPSTQKLMLFVILGHCDNESLAASMFHPTIARECGLSTKIVGVHIAGLARCGVISAHRDLDRGQPGRRPTRIVVLNPDKWNLGSDVGTTAKLRKDVGV